MSTAVFLIVFVAFAARLIRSAAALRNLSLAIALTIAAAGAYFAVYRWVGAAPVIALRVLILAIGFAVPTLLMNAETKPRLQRSAAFFAGVLGTIVAADVFRITGGLATSLLFAIGGACFLVFKARFFEDVLEA